MFSSFAFQRHFIIFLNRMYNIHKLELQSTIEGRPIVVSKIINKNNRTVKKEGKKTHTHTKKRKHKRKKGRKKKEIKRKHR